MDRISFLAALRAVKREAGKRGYCGDLLTPAADVPLVGTYGQQLAIIAIGAALPARPQTTRDRELLRRLVRAAVLTSPPPEPASAAGDHRRGAASGPVARAARQAVARRRQRRARG